MNSTLETPFPWAPVIATAVFLALLFCAVRTRRKG